MTEDAREIAPKGKHLARPIRSVRRQIKGQPLKDHEYVLARSKAGLSTTKRKPSMPKFSWDNS